MEPGQLAQAGTTVPGDLLNTLNNLVGGMSPYGSSGAEALIESISQVGARYFNSVSHDQRVPWLAVIPLADAVTLPACTWPRSVVFVAAFHGGLLGDPSIRALTVRFLAGDGSAPADVSGSQGRLRNAAQLIAGSAAAWRMPQLTPPCPAPAQTSAQAQTQRARVAGRPPIRYAKPRDASRSPPAVVAPPVGGPLNRAQTPKRPPRNRRPLFVSRSPPEPEPEGPPWTPTVRNY